MAQQFPGVDPTDAEQSAVGLLQQLRGRGRDERGAVTIEVDGTGRAVSVEVSSVAMDGNRGAMERAIRQALDAAWDELDRVRSQEASRVAGLVRAQMNDVATELRAFAEAADTKFSRALAAVQAAALRSDSSSSASGGAGTSGDGEQRP